VTDIVLNQPWWWEYRHEPAEPTGNWAHVTVEQQHTCPHPGYTVARCITTGNQTRYTLACVDCGKRKHRGLWISHKRAAELHYEPLLAPLLRTRNEGRTCERCGSTSDIQNHHWAPRHLFDDADLWPSSDLCQPCHTRWHQTTRTGAYHTTTA